MPPVQQARMELDENTKTAISGQIDAHGQADFLRPVLCPICMIATFGEAQVATAFCGHHFHPTCIEHALRYDRRQCPCRAPFPAGQEPTVAAGRAHRELMNGIDVQCPQGCGAVFPFEALHRHVHSAEGCPNTPFRCGNEGCGELFLRKDTAEHIGGCPHRLVPCELCEQLVKHGELQEHTAEHCPRRTVPCPHCEGEHICNEKEQHMRGCAGPVKMRELVEMMAQQQAATAQLRDKLRRQERAVAKQQQTIESQQREIADLRCLAAPPERLIVQGTYYWQGEYVLRPERVNGAAVWGNAHRRIYRTREGHWGMADEADGPERNRGVYRRIAPPGCISPLGAGGWEKNTQDKDMARADGWEARPDIVIAAA